MPLTVAQMTDEQYQKLRAIIHERSGIWFSDNKKYLLENRLGQRLQELQIDNFDQYTMLLTVGPYRQEEFENLFSRITTNETSFFRNQPQLDVFENKILPEMLDARANTKRLRIWSAACSTGEEPFTLAIILHRTLGVRLMDWHIEIQGSDISEKALASAAQGRYTQHALRNVSPLITSQYFRDDGGLFAVSPEIQSMVTYRQLNLKDQAAAKRFGQWDVIFCRNVLIYFDEAMRDGCFELFHSTLAEGGSLLVGHSESTQRLDLFSPRPESQVFAYTKASATQTSAQKEVPHAS